MIERPEPKLPRSAQKRRDRMPDVPDHIGVFPSASAIPPAPPRESDFGTPAEQRRQECSDPCPKSRREDGKHTWQFDGDDPYVICAFCGECRDALTGRTIPESPLPPPLNRRHHARTYVAELEAERDALKQQWEDMRDSWQRAFNDAGRLEAERDALRAALKGLWEQARHTTSCRNSGTHQDCAMCEAIAQMQGALYA